MVPVTGPVSVRVWRVLAGAVVLLATACSSGADSEPAPASPQASPAPSTSTSSADPAATAPQGRWRVRVASRSPYYPGGSSQQQLMIRLVCDEECVGTIETETGVIRTVHWDGRRLTVLLPGHETGAARCFDAGGAPVPGTSTMTVDRSGELVLDASEPDAEGRPTRLEGSYDEDVTVDRQSADCGFPDSFTGTWRWDLESLESRAAEGTA